MKLKFLFSFLIAGTAVASAQGFTDGVHYYRADQLEDAEFILNRTLSDPTTDISTAKYYLGQIAVQLDKFDKAQTLFEEGIAANPENGFNYVGLGEIALNKGDKDAADDYFDQARKLDKKNAVLITDIARAYYNTDPVLYAKDIEKTLKAAKKADKECPAIYILEADMLAKENVGNAAGYYEMAQNYDKNVEHPEAYVKYSRAYFPVSRQFAINGIKRLLELRPESALAQRELAEYYYENEQFGLAADQYGKYIQNPNHFKKDETRYALLLFFSKKYDESLALTRKLLAEDPDNFYMKRLEFINLDAMENFEEAVEKGAKFTVMTGEFTPNDFTTYGDALLEVGQDSLAMVQFEKAISIAPDRADLIQTLSEAYTAAKMYDKAVEAQERYIAANPEHSTNDLMVLARRYQNLAATTPAEDPNKAEYVKKGTEVLNIVNERVPGNYQVLITKARLQLIGNNNEINEESLPTFLEVLSKLDEDPENINKRKNDYSFVLNMLGKYYLTQKDIANTRLYFGRMLEIFPDNADLRTFVESLAPAEEEPAIETN